MIRSRRNPRIVELARLHRARHRGRTGRTLIEGPHLLAEAVASSQEVTEVLALPDDHSTRALCRKRGIPFTPVSGEVLSRVADTKNPRGPVAVLTIPRPSPSGGDVLWLGVSEPGNCGTLIRTSAAFGWDVMMIGGSVDPWAPKVLRAGAGGHFRVAVGRADRASPQATVIAAVARGGLPLSRLEAELDHGRRWWVVIGDEAHGIPPPVADQAHLRCSIPTEGRVESLNAAVAGAIICHHLRGLRRGRAEDDRALSKIG